MKINMAKNQIDIKKEKEFNLIKAALGLKSNDAAINKIIEVLYVAMNASDEETHIALFGVEKTF